MAKNRQIILVRMLAVETDDQESGLPGSAANSMLNAIPLGTYRQVVALLADFNTAPDGSADAIGLLYGPGLLVQLPMVGPDDPVMQVLVSMTEDDIAWSVLTRICKSLKWKMMDPSTGRTFGG